MSSIARAAIAGFNETVGGIRSAQERFKETQEHFVSLMIFCNCEKALVYDKVPVAEVKELTSREYQPCCCTPLYDAMGISINALHKDIKDMEDATAMMSMYGRISMEAELMAPMAAKERKLFRSRSNRENRNYRELSEFQSRVTPERITNLRPGEIFVFGSNLAGMHAGGAARIAAERFGAIMGQGVGLQGQSYAIPTMQGGVNTIQPYVDDFLRFADCHPGMTFLVTRIGCGIAGFTPAEIAPLFAGAVNIPNIHLPLDFWKEIV